MLIKWIGRRRTDADAAYRSVSKRVEKVAIKFAVKFFTQVAKELSEVSPGIWGKDFPQIVPKISPNSCGKYDKLRHITAFGKRALKKPRKRVFPGLTASNKG